MEARLETARLVLAPLDAASLRAALAHAMEVQPADWPDTDVRPWFETWAAALDDAPALAPWGVWLVQGRDGEVVGDVGFKGPPGDDGAVELAYYVRPGHRGCGYAREAVAALVAEARAAGVRVVRAEVHSENAASAAVLERLGFTRVAEADAHEWFELAD
jgi:ribosomal-protein-alanine N-acetyltransferase